MEDVGVSCVKRIFSDDSSGSVLMETLIVMPPLTMLVFIIVQFALVWYAQIMTHYAAFNAARAALVYHESEYRKVGNDGRVLTEFRDCSGPCWQAAVRSLAPVSFSPYGGTSRLAVPVAKGDGGLLKAIPNSSFITNQVAMHVSEDGGLKPCLETNGYVKVCVKFDFPMVVPVAGKMLAYFYHALDPETDGADVGDEWQVWGDSPDKQRSAKVAEARASHPMKTCYVTLHAYCVLSKPYRTSRWALRPDGIVGEVLK